MDNNKKAWLQKLSSDPLYQRYIVKELEQLRPTLPTWNPNEDNTELWKDASAKQNGFDLALTVLAIKPDR